MILNKLNELIQREWLYILLILFIVMINVLIAVTGEIREKGKGEEKGKEKAQTAIGIGEAKAQPARDEFLMKREEIEKVLSQKKYLAFLFNLATLLMLALVLLGIVIDMLLAFSRSAKNSFDMRTCLVSSVSWNIADVMRVIILFLAIAYVVVIIEAFFIKRFPLLKNENFRMILDSTILDITSVVLIIRFTMVKYKEGLISLGLSVKNFFKNVFYGIVGYIATLPILIGILIIIAIIIQITKYVPEKQPIVELFMKEEDVSFLTYTSLFTAIAGPFMEELFFRAFMYNAFKRFAGVFWAMVITSVFFAALHSNIVGFLPIMVIGIALNYLYEKTGTLVSSITLHIIHNLGMVFLVFLIKQVSA